MASATSLLVVEDVVADKNDSSDTRMVTATMQVNGERFTHEFTVTKGSSTMGVLNNWTVKDSLAARVSVDVEGYAQFSVGGVNADASAAGRNDRENDYLFYPASTRSRPSRRASMQTPTPRRFLSSMMGWVAGTTS